MKIRDLKAVLRRADAHHLDLGTGYYEVWSHVDRDGEFYTLVDRGVGQKFTPDREFDGAQKKTDASAVHVGWAECKLGHGPVFVPWDQQIGDE